MENRFQNILPTSRGMSPEEGKQVIEKGLTHLRVMDSATAPLFGRMTAIEMISHLMGSLNLTFYEQAVPLDIPADKIGKAQAFLASKHMIRPGATQPGFYKDLSPKSVSIEDWEKRLDELEALYQKMVSELASTGEDWKKDHPKFGRLNKDQWWQFQGKHFYHHLSQFGIYPRTEIWEGIPE